MELRWLLLALLGCASAEFPSMFGEITSPNYPKVYPDNLVKTWNIRVPEGYGIRLYFVHLDIQLSENCEYDALQVITGHKVQQVFCGRHSFGSTGFPKEKFYPTSHMTLLFKSDSSNQERYAGFDAYYVAADVDECDVYDPCSHFCNNYIGGYFCSCPPEYELQEDQKTCEVVDCGDPAEIANGDANFTHTTYGAKAVYYCKTEYYTLKGDDTYSCSMDGLWLNSNKERELPKCAAVCGKPSAFMTGRIYGGEDAEERLFPWLVRISMSSTFAGGGSLISDRWVVTAAHVVEVQGTPTLEVGNVDYQNGTTVRIKRVILYPDWTKVKMNEHRTDYNNDIALIQLGSRIELDECIYPVCLPQQGETSRPAISEFGYIAGWGEAFKMINETVKRSKTPKILQYTRVPVRDPEDCKKKVLDPDTITSNMLCVGEKGHDSCRGDSGGPLMFQDKLHKRLYMAGIVSFGFGYKCGELGVYTKVQNYVDWIEKTIEKVESEEKDEEQPEPLKICKKKTAEGV